MATIRDIAQLAGVSTATVSRVFTAPDRVLPQTRKRVEKAILETGYIPNTSLRTLRRNSNKNRIIIVAVPDICNPYYSDIIRGIEDMAIKYDYSIFFCNGDKEEVLSTSTGGLQQIRQADGIILLGTKIPFNINRAEQVKLPPMVMACEYSSELGLPTAHIDSLSATFKAVNYLIKLGHRHIAQISAPKQSSLYQFRHQGYQQALHRAGINMKPEYTIEGDFSFKSGEKALKTLFTTLSPLPTAIFCHNDLMAIGAMQAAKKLGLHLPRDLSIIGFDDLLFSQYCDPPLTTMSQPRYEIGQRAMQMLLTRLKDEELPMSSYLLESKLIIRKSTDLPRN